MSQLAALVAEGTRRPSMERRLSSVGMGYWEGKFGECCGVVTSGCWWRGKNPERPSIRVERRGAFSNTRCCLRLGKRGWQPKAKRNHLLFGSVEYGAPGRLNVRFDSWQLLIRHGLLGECLLFYWASSQPDRLGGRRVGGVGGGKLGVLLVPAPHGTASRRHTRLITPPRCSSWLVWLSVASRRAGHLPGALLSPSISRAAPAACGPGLRCRSAFGGCCRGQSVP